MNTTPSDSIPEVPGASADAAPATLERFQFHATGGDYFGIWIVNLLLTVLTLGIYSAWAKVRRNQYFYSSTELAGSSFEYHGNAVAILKGRVLAVLIFAAYSYAIQTKPVIGIAVVLAMSLASPWFLWKGLQFKLHNASYRGIRFGFDGDLRGAYQSYLLRPLWNAVTFGMATPFIHQRMKVYQHNGSRYGTTRFQFDASVGSFYRLYAPMALVAAAGLGLAACMIYSGPAPNAAELAPGENAHMMETGAMFMSAYLWLPLVYVLFMNMLQNLIWNHTRLGQHQFRSEMKWGRTVFIMLSNFVAIVFTLGLYTPFARVRAMRYRIESTSLMVQGSLDAFVGANGESVSALGEGMTEVMDFDLSV